MKRFLLNLLGPTDSSRRSKPTSAHRDELAVIVDHFDHYPLRTTKREGYEIWRLMVLLKRKFRQPDRDMLDQLAAQLSSVSPRNQPWR